MKRGCPLALLPLRSCSPRSHGESSCSTALGECSAPRIPLMVPCRLTTATLWLLLRFDHRRPQKPKLRMPTLFEHKGVVSSLKGKTQTVQDQLLPQEGAKKQLHGDNPPATVESTMSAYGNHIPSNAYLRAPGQFWAQNPKEGATFTVRFNVPQDVQRVVRLYAPPLCQDRHCASNGYLCHHCLNPAASQAVHTGNIAGEAGEHDRLEKGEDLYQGMPPCRGS